MEWLHYEEQIKINARLDYLQAARFDLSAMAAAIDESWDD